MRFLDGIRIAMVAAATMVAGLESGCEPGCLTGSEQQVPACGPRTGEASMVVTCAAPCSQPSGPFRVSSATTCLSEGGGCYDRPGFIITTEPAGAGNGPEDVTVLVDLPAGGGAVGYTLPSTAVQVGGLRGESEKLVLAGGRVDLQESSEEAMAATFEIHLSTADGGRTYVVSGQAAVSGCHLEDMCSF